MPLASPLNYGNPHPDDSVPTTDVIIILLTLSITPFNVAIPPKNVLAIISITPSTIRSAFI